MSAMDHTPSDDRRCQDDCAMCGRQTCLYCGQNWPCEVAEVRLELAKVIKDTVEADKPHRPNWKRGMTDAALLILKGLTRE